MNKVVEAATAAVVMEAIEGKIEKNENELRSENGVSEKRTERKKRGDEHEECDSILYRRDKRKRRFIVSIEIFGVFGNLFFYLFF